MPFREPQWMTDSEISHERAHLATMTGTFVGTLHNLSHRVTGTDHMVVNARRRLDALNRECARRETVLRERQVEAGRRGWSELVHHAD